MTQPFVKLLLAGVAALGLTAAALTISPSSHDFGEVAVQALAEQEFRITLPPDTPRGTILTYTITGSDAIDFDAQRYNRGRAPTTDPFAAGSSCTVGPQALECTTTVEFRPQSMGPKSATLVVTDNHGNRATAALKGLGVAPLCKATVVWCNYAHHYSGVVSWSGGSAGVNVDVVQGVASCNATGDTEITSGTGLIAVEFDQSGDMRASSAWYRITVACPIRYPPEPARQAELGHGEFGSYKQPLGMRVSQLNVARLPRLKGTSDEVSWNLCPHAQYRPPVRAGAGTSGPQNPCP